MNYGDRVIDNSLWATTLPEADRNSSRIWPDPCPFSPVMKQGEAPQSVYDVWPSGVVIAIRALAAPGTPERLKPT
jgi:hypothetical protein